MLIYVHWLDFSDITMHLGQSSRALHFIGNIYPEMGLKGLCHEDTVKTHD